jgi:copper chaperone CopZ
MEKLVLEIPSMYADHHVLAVRAVLTNFEGIEELVASSLQKQIMISYDPAKIKPADIEKGLQAAGYETGEERELPLPSEAKEDEFPWFKSIWGVPQTNILEREMSGDFRKY